MGIEFCSADLFFIDKNFKMKYLKVIIMCLWYQIEDWIEKWFKK